jgi:hypothetical protein
MKKTNSPRGPKWKKGGERKLMVGANKREKIVKEELSWLLKGCESLQTIHT